MAQGARHFVILVDTTVWIDWFKGLDTPQVLKLERLIGENADICVCGVILTEVLQGIRDDKDYAAVASNFESFIYLPMGPMTFKKAAEIYRTLRRKGVTIRNTVDCMIAAVAIEHDIPLLHHDRDFSPIAKNCGLQVIETHHPKTDARSHNP